MVGLLNSYIVEIVLLFDRLVVGHPTIQLFNYTTTLKGVLCLKD